MVHHADHGSQYVSIAYNERLAEYGIIASTGTVGDSYDNALAENVNGSYKTSSSICRFGVVGTASLRSWYRCSTYPVLHWGFLS